MRHTVVLFTTVESSSVKARKMKCAFEFKLKVNVLLKFWNLQKKLFCCVFNYFVIFLLLFQADCYICYFNRLFLALIFRI